MWKYVKGNHHNKKWHSVMKSKRFREQQRNNAIRLGLKPPSAIGNKVNLGRKLSEEHKRKISESHKGKRPYEMTEEIRLNRLKAVRRGKQHPNWRGGISFKPYSLDWSKTLKRSIRERDHYSCKLCGKQQEDKAHHVHHIDYNKKNCNPNNLITLCKNCHSKTIWNRTFWTNYFEERFYV